MDFLKILRSIEELLYEVMSWLIFYPLTLWRSLTHPLRMMRFSDAEQLEKPEQQYLETLSPPLFLVLSILFAYAIEVAFRTPDPLVAGPADGLGHAVLRSGQNLIAFRAIAFSIFPLLFAAAYLRCTGMRLDRQNLKAPFFSQCYPGGVSAIVLSIGAMLTRFPRPLTFWIGAAVILATLAWNLMVQQLWFRKIEGMTAGRAFGVVMANAAGGVALMVMVVAAVTYG